ncbi:MAG: hypothetical protein KDC13_03810, partial [Bacteroidetes bacterium]|nr:hypothetical protein [Bacteroidota bacterium]
GFHLNSQSNKDIRRLGIREVKEVKVNYKKGSEKNRYLKEIRQYDKRGHLILEEHFLPDSSTEWKETFYYIKDLMIGEVGEYPNVRTDENKEGKYKRYNYNYSKNEVIEELELDASGNVVEKTIITRNRFGDKIEELEFDCDGNLKKRTTYEYNKFGLKTRKAEFNSDGELKEEVLYYYSY